MAETGTFSSAVDVVIRKSGRIDRIDDIISAVRRTILDCQTVEFFESDLEEDKIATNNEEPFIWRLPSAFRRLRIARYPGVYSTQGKVIYPEEISPAKRQRDYDYFWYQSGNSIVFSGHAEVIDVAYYTFLPRLAYYEDINSRPARWHDDTLEWTYQNEEEDQDSLRDKVTNWLLFNFFDVVVDGSLNYIFSIVGDLERAKQTFAIYQAGKNIIQRSVGEGGS